MLHVKSGQPIPLHSEILHDGDPEGGKLGSGDGMDLDIGLWRWSGVAVEWWDWNDSSWKALGSVTTLRQSLTVLDDTEAEGVFYRVWTSPVSTEDYMCEFLIRDNNNIAKNVPQQGMVSVGQWMDQIDDIETDTQGIQSRLPAVLVGGRMDSDVGAMQPGVINAAVVATDAIDADALAADSIIEIQSGLATSAALSLVETNLLTQHTATQNAIAALNDLNIADIQTAMTNQGYTTVRAVLLDNLTDLDASISSVLANIAALNDLSQADVQTAMTAQGYTTIRAALLDNLDAAISTVTAAIVALNDIDQSDVQAALTAQGYTTGRSLLLDNLDATISGVPAAVDVVLSAAHGVGTWTGSGSALTAQQVRDAMKLAPTGGAPDAGSVDEHLDDIDTVTAAVDARLPSDPADESQQQAAHTATQLAISNIPADVDTELSGNHGSGSWEDGASMKASEV